ncbi:DUF2397 family protein [Companilactobacillus jidongensis]|uniref:DUF2397 family protein n=1 Tax=Companilactobacillus jidongensis TaxID=2486006 RepID=UPI000F78FB3F|nr:DUF2397 family protein [Companilactobacillus jidongensis]
MSKQFDKITETAYLTADNYIRYRTIMDYFYTQQDQMNNILYADDIVTALRDAILEKRLAGYQEGIINRIVESIRMNL